LYSIDIRKSLSKKQRRNCNLIRSLLQQQEGEGHQGGAHGTNKVPTVHVIREVKVTPGHTVKPEVVHGHEGEEQTGLEHLQVEFLQHGVFADLHGEHVTGGGTNLIGAKLIPPNQNLDDSTERQHEVEVLDDEIGVVKLQIDDGVLENDAGATAGDEKK